MRLRPLLLALAASLALGAEPPHDEKDPKELLEPLHESITITASPLGPRIDPRNAEVFRKTLFTRDDQVFHLLNAGINVGQHEGGGKSLEVRRFGFNLDHGGVNGGLRIGSLKSLTPELVEDVTLINGPFSAEHGDYSGLGVVQVRLKEELPDVWTARLQGGSFNTARAFLAYSPDVDWRDSFFAYEGSHSAGPFVKPLDYVRHNVTGNNTWILGRGERRFGLKWNGGLNEFQSSGQVPLDEVAAGRLDRFGFISPGDGGDIQQGRLGAYWRKDFDRGTVWKADAFIERSLFDLYSNFTFFLNDPELGDAIQQHDSRLSQGGSTQVLKPQIFDSGTGLLTLGGGFLTSQNQVELRNVIDRDPYAVQTAAHAAVTNGSGYVQQQVDLVDGRLELTGGLRWDVFRYAITDQLEPQFSGVETAAKLQPKAGVAYRPLQSLPLRGFFNYGRGIASMDARGVIRQPDSPHLNTTDFYQFGLQQQFGRRASLMADYFIIQNSNQLVYIPDDGSIEFSDPSRSTGFETRLSVGLTDKLSFDGGITKVLNAYYRDTEPRVYVDTAPHFTANASLTLADWRGWSGSLRMRAINRYRLDGLDPSIAAAGHTVFDLAFSRRITRNVDFNFAVDNLFDRDYWEMQNLFESRLPGQEPIERIHGTPGYPATIVVGLTLRFGGK
jgi:outer membrane receptor protein involved in Fe transport